MPAFTDPTDALTSFQQAVLDNEVQLQPGKIDRGLFVHADKAAGSPRFTYATLEKRTVTALVIFVLVEPIEGVHCFQMGCAVPAKYRNQGRAKKAVEGAIAELWNGLSKAGFASLCIEAVVHIENHASHKLAISTLSETSTAITDSVSGLPALHYVRRLSV